MASKQWTRVQTIGRGASGAEVFLASDDVSGELFAVKSATAACASALKREEDLMSCLRSSRVVSCIGGRAARDGSYQLFLEFAPGGSLADRAAIDGGLDERTVRGYAADVAAGLAYLHGAGMVHGDVKARNVVIGADGRAKLADFGCARKVGAGVPIIGGTPAFMAPEVARGEEQGPAADVWALGCTVVEMATGRAPWNGMDGDALAALHRIGYTEAVPEVPQWLSVEAKDFLRRCLVRQASDRCTAAQLLEHRFLASAVVDAKPQAVESKWVSPKSTLDAAFWESESDTDEAEHDSAAERRIGALACPASALPEWDSDEGWIDVLSAPTEAVAVPAKETTVIIVDDAITSEEESVDAESGFLDIAVDVEHSSFLHAGETYEADPVVRHCQFLKSFVSGQLVPCSKLLVQTVLCCNIITDAIEFVVTQTVSCLALLLFFVSAHNSAPHCDVNEFKEKLGCVRRIRWVDNFGGKLGHTYSN
ncbi:mitogen-activated protein kinase kinase kinase 18-like [Aegilops tauschii subsp. strangulata]|uniref:Protein kinase domain-containing protein n=2 Tax=Triticinae TaxID=1648030 RepID=A0A3B5ZZU8_WHEAT|nr:mitogen-activated protein kinase kinase kinase 17-like [Aegilops tauschii subsp. strangulata]XP_044434272.1 mitogen-activated protein kinase kinase kinase 17-like [Triticum aestivum]